MKFLPLQKEENVLAQEDVLDALLSSKSKHEQWIWDKKNQTEGVYLLVRLNSVMYS